MIIEQVTVTTTPTSISQLLATARSETTSSSKKCDKVKMRCSIDADIAVEAKDNSTHTAITILDAPKGLYASEIELFDTDHLFLSVASGTLAVDLIIEQGRTGRN